MVMGNQYVTIMALIVAASTVGFLVYNFHPAKIFMGDTGALFLGYIIAVLSLLGYKNVTFISLIIPIIILGVPISDTFFAIIRRLVNKQPLSAPDKSHLHHCLLKIRVYSSSNGIINLLNGSPVWFSCVYLFTSNGLGFNDYHFSSVNYHRVSC